MKITANLQNKARTFSRLQSAIDQRYAALEKIVQQAGLEMQAEAKKRVRVDTGRLRSSIMQRLERQGKYKITAIVDTNVKYAKFIEYGTKYMKAYPFLRPAHKIALANYRKRVKNLK